jgi:hypothetical protein
VTSADATAFTVIDKGPAVYEVASRGKLVAWTAAATRPASGWSRLGASTRGFRRFGRARRASTARRRRQFRRVQRPARGLDRDGRSGLQVPRRSCSGRRWRPNRRASR